VNISTLTGHLQTPPFAFGCRVHHTAYRPGADRRFACLSIRFFGAGFEAVITIPAYDSVEERYPLFPFG
jgi:hypothetical protein